VGSIPSCSTVFFTDFYKYYNLSHLYLSQVDGVYWKKSKAKITTRRNQLIQTSIFTKYVNFVKFTGTVKKNFYGRAVTGRRACWTKGGRALKFFFSSTKQFTYLNFWYCVTALIRSSRTGRWYNQLKTSCGLTVVARKVAMTGFFSPLLISTLKWNLIIPVVTYLCWVSNNTIIFSFSLRPADVCAVARASGSCGYYLTHASATKQFAIIIFPSGVLKLLSKFILVTTRVVGTTSEKFIKHPSAGFYRRHGKHPNTRGIAMNATDHPHGGKTHTVAAPVSPWGKNTKLK
jgi:Ribosomal Proteins L2, C-terminal domain